MQKLNCNLYRAFKMNPFIDNVKSYIQKNKLLQPQSTVIVGISGGADSVALLLVLHEIGYSCIPVHCNFNLRGNESDRDEDFVKTLCEKLNMTLYVKSYNTQELAKKEKNSIEMTARNLRYALFEHLRKELGASAIAVAHHRDDNVETVLLNVLRGTGIKGLRGIRPRNGFVVRPLLDIDKTSILAYLSEKKQKFVEDSTNKQPLYKRNKIRLELLPQMRLLNPSIDLSIQRMTHIMSSVFEIYEASINSTLNKLINREADKQVIKISDLIKVKGQLALLYEWLNPYGFSGEQVEQIANGLTHPFEGYYETKNQILWRNRGLLILLNKSIPPFVNKSSYFLNNNESIIIENKFSIICEDTPFPRDKNFFLGNNAVLIDYNKLRFPLCVRHIRNGDRFCPFGMKGHSKLVSDYMTDRKKSRIEKEEQWVVCNGDDIVWLIGERLDNRFALTEQTNKVMKLSVKYLNT